VEKRNDFYGAIKQENNNYSKNPYFEKNYLNQKTMQKKLLTLLFSLSYLFITAQIVSISPSSAGADDNATLIFDATQGNGELVGASKVYAHHGVVISGPSGTDWSYVIGNWGQDDGVGEMTLVAGETDKWELELTPTIRQYFGANSNDNLYRISMVFRSADGGTKGTISAGNYGWGTVTANLDMYLNLDAGDFVSITSPTNSSDFINPGENVTIGATASSAVTSMKIWIDEGTGFEEKASVNSGTTINYSYAPTMTTAAQIKITATINGIDYETVKSYNITVVQPSNIQALPAGVIAGINYDDTDATKVTLVLQAPGKEYVYAVGDFSNWETQDIYQMNKTPDGEYFWVELTGLTAQQQYVFQYWINGNIKIGDPYADQVADPWNDQWIDASVFPNIPFYDKTDFSIATVFQTGQNAYVWGSIENTWQRPDVNHLMIYELLVRDFIGTHNWNDLRDTLSYIKNLGVDAIEIMPFNEFEGNESWGYNPSYYFAPDKYYGTKDDLKKFIETCHEMGLAVIMDMVLNHAFGENPMVRMYFDSGAGTPSADNPWFNKDYVGPFQWGYDFNHESSYTEDFIDRVNRYWIDEFHVDGYRFDFTKGMTNNSPGGSIDGFDQSRIDILKRMADVIWNTDSEAYIILEHWGPAAEETQLANYGMKLWRNRSYDFVPAANGFNSGGFGGMQVQSHVSFFDSHDERRIAEHMISEGQSNGGYNVKEDAIMYERAKMAAAFAFLHPGPKMMWQFDELGYDIHIDFNGRVGNKPLPWGPDGLGYYEDPLRKYIYDAYKGILDVRNQIGPDTLAFAQFNHKNSGDVRRIAYNASGEIDLVVIGNFGLETAGINPQFAQAGMWYDYFSGDSIDVTITSTEIELKAGEWHIYTSKKISDGHPGVIAVYDNPVTITPYPFTKNNEITIRFDATKAFPNGTAGLVGADKVYIHSGVVLDSPNSTALENVVGNLVDDGVGEMTEVMEDIWEITLTPSEYYSLSSDQEPFKLGMYFRDANNVNLGYGFRDSEIFFDVESDLPFIQITPESFEIDDEITITFNAAKGNGELIGADKIYIHSSVDLTNTSTPQNSAWDNVVGNWGQDDGVGEMSPSGNTPDLWEITLTPQDYYGLPNGSDVTWVAAVFRSADGNVKGTGNPGPLPNGFIHTNQDFFIQNQPMVATRNLNGEIIETSIFPNPTYANQVQIAMKGISGNVKIELIDLTGKVLRSAQLEVFGKERHQHDFDLGNISKGMYFIKIIGDNIVITEQLIKL